jgi:hypothetical protein
MFRSPRKTRPAVLAVLAALCLSVAMVPVAMTAPPASGAPALSSHLLVVADMPSGWRAATAASTESADAVTLGSCLALARKLPKGGTQATATFSGPTGLPAFQEDLASGATGQEFFRSLVRGLSGCKTLSARTGSKTVTAKVSSLRFPQVGVESHAFRLVATETEVPLHVGVVLFRTAGDVGLTAYVTLGSPGTATQKTFVALTQKAARRST